MDQLEQEYQLSLYETLAELNNSPKSEVLIVQNSLTGKIYIKKILKNYNIEVYRTLKRIKVRYLPKIEELFETQNQLIVIEEYINGRTLEEYLSEEGRVEETVVIKWGIRLCEALDLLHNQNPPIIHRDIKPSNIMISEDGILKLIDFDVSRVYQDDRELDTHILGTKGYASPEQFGFEQTDARSDIYSIGVLMNVLTTGKEPKMKKNPSKLGRIIDKCTKLSPNERYQSVAELKSELSKLIAPPHIKQEPKYEESLLKQKLDLYLNYFDFLDMPPKRDEKKTIFQELRQIPGYRRGNLLYMVVATLWYAFLLFGAFGASQGEPILIWLENITLVFCLLGMTLLTFNYKQIQRGLPIIRDNLLGGLVVYNLLFIMIWGFINKFIEVLV